MNIVQITADSLTLSSALSQDSFAKTHLIDLLAKKSLLVHIKNGSVTSEDYSFTGTKAGENGITLFEGKPIQGKTLSNILALPLEERAENDTFALASFSRAVDFLLKQEEPIASVGAGGIIVQANKVAGTADILFLNAEIFEICAQNHKEHYANLQGKYLYKGLDNRSALAFTRAVVAYTALTAHFPFENNDTTKRQEDIFDSNFIPLELWDSSVKKKLAESIHASLSLQIKTEIRAGKRSIVDAKAEAKRKKLLKTAENFDSADFETELERISHEKQGEKSEEAHLSEKRAEFIKKTARTLSVKRFFRRNKNRILAALAAAFVISWFISGFVRENAKLVTTTGLTSTQATHALYTMIHRADVPNVQEIVQGKDTKDLITKVSGYFVSVKQRLEVSPDNGSLPPAQWLFYRRESKSWMFGITNLTIDGETFKIESNSPARKDKPLPVSEEKGKPLTKGDEVTHSVSYNFVHQAEAKFYIERMSDTVTLRWTGKQWRVVKIEGNAKVESVKAKTFVEEYYSLAETSSVRAALETLRETYDWLPHEEDMRDAAEFLNSEYGSVEAEKFLNSK